jgi:hypothetical protein
MLERKQNSQPRRSRLDFHDHFVFSTDRTNFPTASAGGEPERCWLLFWEPGHSLADSKTLLATLVHCAKACYSMH